MLRSIGKQNGKSIYLNKLTTCHIEPEEEKKAKWAGFAGKEGFKPGMKKWG